mmetsp:Transcript_62459/g.103907  ORF Transcript_62459/g.103907 Transcript_62459/m.103907 type:complete len:113 (+) Transcript_62459:318-656(+)
MKNPESLYPLPHRAPSPGGQRSQRSMDQLGSKCQWPVGQPGVSMCSSNWRVAETLTGRSPPITPETVITMLREYHTLVLVAKILTANILAAVVVMAGASNCCGFLIEDVGSI